MDEGETIDLRQLVRERIDLGNQTLLTLKSFKAKNLETPSITVTQPTNIEAVYKRNYLTTFMIRAGEGFYAEPETVTLVREDETTVYTPPASYLAEGEWIIASIRYRGYEVSAGGKIEIRGPGQTVLNSLLKTVTVKIVDYIGIPIPFTEVTAMEVKVATGWDGVAKIPAIPPADIPLSANYLTPIQATIPADRDTVEVKAPVSPYTAIALLASTTITTIAWRRRRIYTSRQPA